MTRIVLLSIAAAVLVGLLAVLYLRQSMLQPLYEPGAVSAERDLRYPLEPPPQDEDPHWEVEPDVELQHFAQGEGRDVLVVHGGPGQPAAEPWPGLVPLEDEFRFHHYHQRGSGGSSRPVESFDSWNYLANAKELEAALGLSAQIADIERIRRILGQEKLILVGHSFGALQAALYAAEFPERVEALVLVTPAPLLVMPLQEPDLFENIESRLPEDERAAFQAWYDEYMDFASLFERSEDELVALNEELGRYFEMALAEQGATLPAGARPGGWMVHAQYLSLGQDADLRPAMAAVTCPVLLLHAEDDMQSEAATRSYQEAIPHADFRVLEDAGHMPYQDQPEDFAAELEGFLDGLESGTG